MDNNNNSNNAGETDSTRRFVLSKFVWIYIDLTENRQ